jgi:hypothetical protein
VHEYACNQLGAVLGGVSTSSAPFTNDVEHFVSCAQALGCSVSRRGLLIIISRSRIRLLVPRHTKQRLAAMQAFVVSGKRNQRRNKKDFHFGLGRESGPSVW